MDTLLIRPIDFQDNNEVSFIIRNVMTEYNCDGPGYSIHDLEVNNMSDYYLEKNKAIYFVAIINQKIIGGAGIAQLQNSIENICELRKMYILSDYRKLKIGQKLYDKCEEAAKKFKYEKIYLETTSQMKEAQNFYIKNKFIKINNAMGDTGHFSCNNFFLKKLD